MVLARTECISAIRENGLWQAKLSSGESVEARAVVNAAGPWVKTVLNARLSQPSRDEVRLAVPLPPGVRLVTGAVGAWHAAFGPIVGHTRRCSYRR